MLENKKISVLEAYEEYLIFVKNKLKKQSVDTLKYDFENRILPYFENFYLEDITSKDIILWQDSILELNFSNNFNRKLYFTLSGFFEYCKNYYGFDKKIITKVGCFKKIYEETKADFYNLNEFKKFIKYVDKLEYKLFFELMFYTGTRPGEAMALKFRDLKNGYINVNKTINSHGKREIGTPKNRTSIRRIKIDRKLEKDLLSLKDFYKKKYKKFDNDYFIFGGIKPLAPTTINRYKIKACEKANLRPITLHQFRHSHATLLLQKNMLVNEVSRRLGHSKTSTTLNIYTHTDLTQEKRVINTLNSIRFNLVDTLKYNFEKIKSILKH